MMPIQPRPFIETPPPTRPPHQQVNPDAIDQATELAGSLLHQFDQLLSFLPPELRPFAILAIVLLPPFMLWWFNRMLTKRLVHAEVRRIMSAVPRSERETVRDLINQLEIASDKKDELYRKAMELFAEHSLTAMTEIRKVAEIAINEPDEDDSS